MTPMPNHLSTLKPHHNRVENTLQNNKNHTKQCGKEERSVGMVSGVEKKSSVEATPPIKEIKNNTTG